MREEVRNLSCDHEAARLLPWFVAGTLPPEDQPRVQAHLEVCPICAADEQHEQRVQKFVRNEPSVEYAPQPGYQKLITRIDELEREMPQVCIEAGQHAVPTAARPAYFRWLAAAVVVQAIGLGILATLLWQQSYRLQAPVFSTLTAPERPLEGAAQLRVVFAPDMKIAQVQTLLAALPGRVVAGPSDAGVYTVSLTDPSGSADKALATLRASDGVLFAELQ